MNVTGFATVLESMAPREGGWSVNIPQDWRQGRTAYGGLSAALALEACLKDFPDLPPLRSTMVNFIGPVTVDPIFKSMLLRQGRNVTMVEVKAFAEEALVLSVTFSFGGSRQSEMSVDFTAPSAPKAESCDLFTPPAAKAFVPSFFHNFDTRLIEGGRPMSGADKGYIRAWSRHQDQNSREGASSLLCIADVLPPAAMPLFKKMGPVSSMTWMCNILVDDISTQHGWWHLDTNLTAARGGYASQVMRIWNSEGELVVEGMQSVAMFI